MTQNLSRTAMVLAAGLGTRMRPMTLTTPKPLHVIGGRTMIDLALDRLVRAGIERVAVNVFYLAEQIERHLQTRRDIDIILSRETELLDTGGGIANILPLFEGKPFFVLNADLPWTDGAVPSLTRMRACWDAEKMDALLLLMRREKARGFEQAKGDFALAENGRVWRKNLPPPRPYVMISAQILQPGLFADPPGKVFSNNHVWDKAESWDRLYGIEHDGACYHVGTVEDWRRANALLESGQGWGIHSTP